jgi:hypothetical protein
MNSNQNGNYGGQNNLQTGPNFVSNLNSIYQNLNSYQSMLDQIERGSSLSQQLPQTLFPSKSNPPP